MELQLLLTAAVIMMASFFATVSGFGFALVATPLLSLFMEPKEAVVFVLLTAFVLRIITMVKNRCGFEWPTVLAVTFGSLLGIIPGSIALKLIGSSQLEIFLGAVLLVATLLMGQEVHFKIRNKTLGRITAGFFSGFFGSSTSVSGPPLVLYFLNENMEKNLMRANMIWSFGLNGILILAGSYLAGTLGYITADPLTIAAGITGLLIGWWTGEQMFYRLNQHLFRRLALVIVCAGAIGMLYNGLKSCLM